MASTNVTLRRPLIKIKFITEDNDYEIQYNTGISLPSDGYLGESLISLVTKNALSDDAGAFTFVVTGDTYWDKILNANDLVSIKIYPNGLSDLPTRPTVMLGMISEVTLEGDYGSDGKIYRISGQSLAKAFINLKLGMINAVNVNLYEDIGWLTDTKVADGTNMFTGSSAKNIALHLYDRFKGYMNYNFVNNNKKTGITDYLELDLDSWTQYESLTTATPFINYEGSFKQLLDDVTQKPFNELFFESMENETAKMIMRPTPFDEDKWGRLETNYLSSATIIEEDLSRSDNEAYSVFVVNVEDAQALGLNSLSFGVYPQTFLPLVAKFGYSPLEVSNRYLIGTSQSVTTDNDDDDTTKETTTNAQATQNINPGSSLIANPTPLGEIYNGVISVLESYELKDLRLYKNQIISDMKNVDNRITTDIANSMFDYYREHSGMTLVAFSQITKLTEDNAINEATQKRSYTKVLNYLQSTFPKSATAYDVEIIKKGLMTKFKNINSELALQLANKWVTTFTLTKDDYTEVVNKYKNTTSSTSGDVLKLFTQKLANWYCENPNFYAGSIKITGDPNFRVGNRLLVRDKQEDVLWEFYIESVQHDFSYVDGYTSTLGVTRGLRGENERFSNLYGTSVDFVGGYLGERSLAELEALNATESSSSNNTSSNSSSSGTNTSGVDGSQVAMKALAYGMKYIKETGTQTIYVWGGGRSGSNPFDGAQPYKMDCSAFVYWCYRAGGGVNLAGGATGMTTWTMIADPQLKRIEGYENKDSAIFDRMRKGDIVFFGSGNTHVGIYAGSKKFIAFNGASNYDTTHGCELSLMDSGYWWDEFKGRVLRYG